MKCSSARACLGLLLLMTMTSASGSVLPVAAAYAGLEAGAVPMVNPGRAVLQLSEPTISLPELSRSPSGARPTRLATVPVPGSLCLFATAVLGAGIVARRKLAGCRREAVTD